jgi:hypothetical protein
MIDTTIPKEAAQRRSVLRVSLGTSVRLLDYVSDTTKKAALFAVALRPFVSVTRIQIL